MKRGRDQNQLECWFDLGEDQLSLSLCSSIIEIYIPFQNKFKSQLNVISYKSDYSFDILFHSSSQVTNNLDIVNSLHFLLTHRWMCYHCASDVRWNTQAQTILSLPWRPCHTLPLVCHLLTFDSSKILPLIFVVFNCFALISFATILGLPAFS